MGTNKKSRFKPYAGVALIVIGALLLLVCYILHFQSNAELLTGLLLIILGAIGHVWLQKQAGKY
jgi:lipoprotein signal peptidase